MTKRIRKDTPRTPASVTMGCKECSHTWYEDFVIPMYSHAFRWRLRYLLCNNCGSRQKHHEVLSSTDNFFFDKETDDATTRE